MLKINPLEKHFYLQDITRKTAETFGISSTNSFLCNELKAFLSGELIQNYCNKHIDNQNKLN